MKPIPNDLYDKIERVSETVRRGFLNKGIVIPIKNRDGSINLGRFKIVNQHNGFYAIYDQRGESVVDQINLPQTAALIANDLALNRWLDKQLLDQDRQYGYTLFEENLYKQRLTKKNQPLDLFEIALSRNTTLKRKRENYERDIIKKFEKLRKLT